MSTSNDGDKNGKKRSLPSWMSSRPGSSGSGHSKSNDEAETETADQEKSRSKIHHANTVPEEVENEAKFSKSTPSGSNFSKLMEGVVFVLSGFVNPERGTLRSQALEMGAKYQADWNSDSTLLICAFSNTPKFRQVEADNGTIVLKDWITECYKQRKLVEIETYLMHAGKPWKHQSVSHESSQDQKPSTSRKSYTRAEKSSLLKTTTTPSSKVHCDKVKEGFSPAKVKSWALDDLNRTISWLENQDEKPEPHEMKKIAAEGILTCLQDAIDSLKQEQDLRQITEQWECIPHAVEELTKFDGSSVGSATLLHKDLCKQAVTCKQIYELEYRNREDNELLKMKKQRTRTSGKAGDAAKDNAAYDSDDTIEMTEEEINQAYNAVASTIKNTERV